MQNVWFETGPTPYLMYGRGHEIKIETEIVLPVQYDGEVAGTTPVTAVVVPGALRVVSDGIR